MIKREMTKAHIKANIAISKTICFVATLFLLTSCGVKGDPLPPLKPAELGRGRPTYKRAFRNIQIQNQPESKGTRENKQNEEIEADGTEKK